MFGPRAGKPKHFIFSQKFPDRLCHPSLGVKIGAVVPPFPHKPSRRARGLYIGNTLYVQTFLKTRKLHIQGTFKNRAAGSSERCHPGTKQSVVRTSSMIPAVKMSNVIIFRDIQGSLFATQLSYIQMKLLPAYLNNSII